MLVDIKFDDEFSESVALGDKPGTIRKTKKCNVGDEIQLSTNIGLLALATCTAVAKIRLTPNSAWTIHEVEGNIYTSRGGQPFHELEGFKSTTRMVDYIRDKYGLPFNGYYHQWELNQSSEGQDNE